MKKTEIKDGVDYAVSWSNEYRSSSRITADRVTVLGPARTAREHGRTRSVVPVRFANGNNGTVPTREFREEWATYAEYLAAREASRTESARRARIDLRARLRVTRALVADLRKSGLPLETYVVYERGQAQTLANFGITVMLVEQEFGGDTMYVVAPLASSIVDYAFKGSKIQIPADVLIGIINGNA